MYHTTGLTEDEIIDLCAMIKTVEMDPGVSKWPPILDLFKSVVVALTYLRRNRVQAELAETYGVSQSTISRAVTGITPRLEKVLRKFVPTADELDAKLQYIVDGTLLPCWSWGVAPGTLLRKTQDYRHERAGRLHHERQPRMDLRPD